MKKRINIYISCSTKSDVLTEQKNAITKLLNEMNQEYSSKRIDINIKTVGYDDLERRNIVFKEFTKKNADIIVFLVDNIENEEKYRTQEIYLTQELNYAVKRYRKYCRPVILIYLPEKTEKSLSDKLKNIFLDNNLVYERVKDTSKLEEEIRKNIQVYINSYSILHKIQFWAKVKWWIIKYVLPALLIIAGGLFLWANKESQPRLLLAGGGSAYNLIKEEYLGGDDSKIKNDRFIIYAPIPSGNAYGLLSEETEMDERNFHTIVLSAEKASDSSFLRSSIVEFRKTGVVMGLKIGYDYLALFHTVPIPSTIDSIYMDSIINKTKVPVYTTNKNSGTLNAYIQEIIKTEFEPTPEHVFYSTRTILDTNWIALGSQHYHPQNLVKHMVLKDVPPKPVYIYFMRYRKEKNGEVLYELPYKVKDFLKEININDSIIGVIDTFNVSDMTRILFDNFETQGKYKK